MILLNISEWIINSLLLGFVFLTWLIIIFGLMLIITVIHNWITQWKN